MLELREARQRGEKIGRPIELAEKIFFFNEKMTNVSCEYDRWVVETQLCKLRDTSDTLIGHACAMFHL